jgi:DNA-binding GntR family transcriptional regulator
MCNARDTWHTKFSGHLRQAVQGAIAKHQHFHQHQAFSAPVEKEEVEKAVKALEDIFGRNRSGHC